LSGFAHEKIGFANDKVVNDSRLRKSQQIMHGAPAGVENISILILPYYVAEEKIFVGASYVSRKLMEVEYMKEFS
jgi:hypothetical protein